MPNELEKDALKILNNPIKYIEDLRAEYEQRISEREKEIRAEVEAELREAMALRQSVRDVVRSEASSASISREPSAVETINIEDLQNWDALIKYHSSSENDFIDKMIYDRQTMNGFVLTLVKGPHGSGKTLSCFHYAKQFGIKNVIRIDCSVIRDAEKWFGERKLENNETKFVASPFVDAIEKGNCVIILDEINRIADMQYLNPLLPLFDFSGKIHIQPLRKDVSIGRNIACFLTVNEGLGYTGVTNQLDNALLDRVHFAKICQYPSEEIEKKIILDHAPNLDEKHVKAILTIANAVRKQKTNNSQITWSIRNTINAAVGMMLSNGNPKSLEYTILNMFRRSDGIKIRGYEALVGAITGQYEIEQKN